MFYPSLGLDLSQPQLMGILNVTPDSFYDGGTLYKADAVSVEQAVERAAQMHAAGAAIIDVGGESTRPNAAVVTEREELARVIPVIEALSKQLDVVISVDTSSPEVMKQASAAGAKLINDVRALTRDKALETAAELDVAICLMHMQGQPDSMQNSPRYTDVVTEVHDFLQVRIQACQQAGIGKQRLLLDPGFGFGKNIQHNLRLLNKLDRLQDLGLPILVGTSRKSMFEDVLGRALDQRLAGSLATAILAVQKGAKILRVHDVAETQDVVRVLKAVANEDIEG